MRKPELSKYHVGNRPEVAAYLPDVYQTVLEIGCGDGAFRQHLKSDCEYWGVEPANLNLSDAGTDNVKILRGYFEQIFDDIPNEYFDLVICNDVIEHVPDHDVFLQKIKKKMKTNSSIVGSIPNVRYYDNLYKMLKEKNWEYQDSGILDRTHLRFFTFRSLEKAFSDNGYRIEILEGINSILNITRSIRKLFRYYYLNFILLLLGGGSQSDIKYQQFVFCVKVEK